MYLDTVFHQTTLDLRKEFLKSRFDCNGIFHTGVLRFCWHDDDFLIVFVCALLQCSFIMRKFEDAFSSEEFLFVCLLKNLCDRNSCLLKYNFQFEFHYYLFCFKYNLTKCKNVLCLIVCLLQRIQNENQFPTAAHRW